jgi:hypothetical protein
VSFTDEQAAILNAVGRVRPKADCQNLELFKKMQSSFDTPTECYQAIGAALAGASRSAWDNITLDATLEGMRVDVVVGCWRSGSDEPVEYLTGIPRLASYIYDLARLVSTEEKGLFKKCRFNLYKNGKFDVNFTY